MTEKSKQTGNALTALARQECANFRRNDECCIKTDKFCKILAGKPCAYFRDAVLRGCDPAYPYAKNTQLFPRLLKQYRKLDPAFTSFGDKKVRTCPDCGTSLKKHKTLCDKCARKRRLVSYRKKRDKSQ